MDRFLEDFKADARFALGILNLFYPVCPCERKRLKIWVWGTQQDRSDIVFLFLQWFCKLAEFAFVLCSRPCTL